MAVGVPEADVFAAADRVLERGERPTVERVRLELGRGSPARVGQLLEAWWDALAKRLAGETRLPALPSAASAAFTDLWRVAMNEARAVAERELEEQRAAVEAERAQFQADRSVWDQQIAQAAQARVEADTARSQATERLEDLQRLTTQLEHQAVEGGERQKALESQLQAAECDRRALQEHVSAREAAAAQEREAAAQHLRAIEDRSHAEVDRARQEAKLLRTEVERAERAHQQEMRESHERESELRQRLGQAERTVGEHAARVRALDEQLARLDGLGDALRSAQDAVRAGLDREAQLRQALEEAARRTSEGHPPDAAKPPRRKVAAKAKR
ncbi:DNA-binding protein [Pseudoxanthomonas sp. SE1]|uniref:DNA-binding protein n=1 Tax=Pseudoxanthomonas sp. SE1 TaxID=1664560 RepID=UPI00240DC4B3|nr:DNA-binding protein [Pseudoxanthomonas sp. SE1]WFC40260.1 DNA-binding protein [Pseudoxanthomonas sp. SE1]WFC43737.1 DNA-binding protein [Pseudoxanthomonas sp. SE1]